MGAANVEEEVDCVAGVGHLPHLWRDIQQV